MSAEGGVEEISGGSAGTHAATGGRSTGGTSSRGGSRNGSAGSSTLIAGSGNGNTGGTGDTGPAGAGNEAGTSNEAGTGGTSSRQPDGTCEGYSDKLERCGLIDRAVDCSVAEDTAVERCSYGCIESSECGAVESYTCSSAQNSISNCLADCKGFRCNDDTVIPLSYRCDAVVDCSAGEDEANCVTCDGHPLEADYICDGIPDCADGRDEQGCPLPPTFACTSGESIPGEYRCDGYRDCADGSDEVDCPKLTCPMP